MEYIEITLTYESIVVYYNGKEYWLSADDYHIDYSSDREIIIRENSDIPIVSGEEVFRFPSMMTVIHHIAE